MPVWVGPTALLLLSGFFVGVVIWGFLNPADIRVEDFDAGRADRFRIGEVTSFPEQNLYVVGMEDGRLRAIDGRVEASGCAVRWQPGDARGRPHNPLGRPGVFEDPCTGAIWSMIANGIDGTDRPLRAPFIHYRAADDGGATHAYIERVNP